MNFKKIILIILLQIIFLSYGTCFAENSSEPNISASSAILLDVDTRKNTVFKKF